MVGFKNKLPFFLSGSTAGLDAPQAGAVFVGHGWNRTAAAPTSEEWEGWQLSGEVLRSRHWPDTSKKEQKEINISTARFSVSLFNVGVRFAYRYLVAALFYADTQIEAVMLPQYQSLFIVSKLKQSTMNSTK